MKIKSSHIYPGPSIYGNVPVVVLELDGLAKVKIEPDQVRLLARYIPALAERHQACLTEWESAAVAEPAKIIDLFERLCIELQIAAGCEVSGSYVSALDVKPGGHAVIAYEDSRVGMAAAELVCDWLSETASAADAELQIESKLNDFLGAVQRKMLPVQDRTLVRQAHSADIPVFRLAGRLLVLGHGKLQQRLSATKTTHTNIIANDIAANKDYARRLLAAAGLPIPKYARMSRIKSAVAAAEEIGYPVVVKPNNGQMGRGVSVGMRSAREVKAAYKRAREVGRSTLVEELVPGADYRMIVIDGQFCAASKRVPAHIVGDGHSTVQQLVDEVNRDPRRGEGPRFSWTRIKIDEQALRLLAELDYDVDSVPAKDEMIFLRRNANTSDGGTAVDVTDDVHPDNALIAIRAAKALGLDIAGVDLLTEDISQSIFTHGGAICEINSRPGLRKHIWPAEGKPRDVFGPLLNMLFPEGGNGRIKTVLVTGNGKRSAVARLLAQRLADQGSHVGLVTSEGVEIDHIAVPSSHMTPDQATRMLLLDADVDAAVIELSPDDIAHYGIELDAVDVCCIVEVEQAETAAAGSDRETQQAALHTAAGIAREAVVVIADTEASCAEIEAASLVPMHRLATIADLDASLSEFASIFKQGSASSVSLLVRQLLRRKNNALRIEPLQ